MLLHSAVTVAHRCCQPNTAVRPQMQWTSGASVWRGTLFGKLHSLKDLKCPLSRSNFLIPGEYKGHTWLMIRLCFAKHRYRHRYTALLLVVKLKMCWQQHSL